MSFLIRWIVTAIAVAAAVWLIPGIEIIGGDSAWVGIVIFALFLSLILGIFYLVVNTALLYLAAWLANGLFGVGFWISGFGSAFLASIVISIVSAIVNAIVAGDNNKANSPYAN